MVLLLATNNPGKIAEIKNIEIATVDEITTSNARKIFNI